MYNSSAMHIFSPFYTKLLFSIIGTEYNMVWFNMDSNGRINNFLNFSVIKDIK